MSQLAPFSRASLYPQPGTVIDGKYRVEQLLGEGGMGAVAKATHLLRRAPVALKFMSPAVFAVEGAVQRFINEGVAASRIDCDNVVKVFDVGQLPNGAPYLVMEYLDGLDLGQLIRRDGGPLETHRAVHFGLQSLRALQAAHSAGIIHRDVKPSNCFVIAKDGEADFVKLVDFGISKVLSDGPSRAADLTHTNSALGTPMYMAPEQARSPRDVDSRADLYSVGAILYELLSGRPPYFVPSGEYAELLYKMFTSEPDLIRTVRPEISGALAAVVHRALTRDPDARFASALEMADALAPFADERSEHVLYRLRASRRRSIAPPVSGSASTPPALPPTLGTLVDAATPAATSTAASAIVPPPPSSAVHSGSLPASVVTATASIGPASVVPPVPVYGEAVTAQTFLAPPTLPTGKEPTHVGVTRDARAAAGSGGGRAAVAIGVGAVAFAAIVATGVVVVRRATVSAPIEPTLSSPATSSAPSSPARLPEAPIASAPPSASALAETPPVSSADAAGSAAPAKPPRDGTRPSTLGGIQMH